MEIFLEVEVHEDAANNGESGSELCRGSPVLQAKQGTKGKEAKNELEGWKHSEKEKIKIKIKK